MILYIFLLVLIVYALDFCIHATKRAKMLDKVDGPALMPFLGNVLKFVCSPAELFYAGRAMSNTYPQKYRVWGVDKAIINLYDPHDYEIILSSSKHITKSYLYEFLHPWLNEGLLTSSGEKWHTRRKILTPAFHFNILKQFMAVFQEESEKLVKDLEKEVGNTETSILPYISNFTLKTICETAMGTKLDKLAATQSNLYIKSIKEMSCLFIKRFVRAWLHPTFLFSLTNDSKQQTKVLNILHGFTNNVIGERRAAKNVNGDLDVRYTKNRLAMLDLLLAAEAEGKIDNEGIREEVDTFMFEGHDTTTMAISFCLMSLANNEEVQEEAYQEVCDILDDSKELSIEMLNKMEYLDMCIKETLRLYPSVTMLGRYVTEDVQLNGYSIAAGTTCHLHVFDLHRRADIYRDPTKFDPQRFNKENTLKRNPFAYVPFSAGARNCIGQKFAMYELKTVISTILKNYKLLPITRPDDIIFTADLILKPKDPINIKFIKRKL